jgi:hypothetical protein
MFETLWPRVRTLARGVGFLAGLAVIGVASLSILQTPVFSGGATEPTRQIAVELLAIVGACMWMLLVTRL